ncbi:roadblock/LC7 domain-containing protein [Streptomyces sp. TRM68416]|uniref:roadblock/LC7 domain-containing protein n=1 Tax=Streptomyces sp. TRM68416 TaxID=2758412 RepID=UPI001661F4F9|nr:roadblock/LC7 domain-containing protein [Streptomyces sp. TRM68416]MBD0838885.1 roadblock/LC7 domain-containing protein [Streptomyces sp. TRM68416]
MVQDIADNVPRTRAAVVLSADGIPRGSTAGLTNQDVRTISAAMAGMQSLSRATAHFAGSSQDRAWIQTVIEFQHGWVFLIGAGQGAYLAAGAEPDVDMEQLSFRMNRLVSRLGSNLTAPPRVTAGDVARAGNDSPAPHEEAGRSVAVLAELDKAVASVPGALHALLLGPDGLPRGASAGVGRDLADTISAAMTGIHAYSRATAPFAGGQQDDEWSQTVIEFQHGWVFLIGTDEGDFLAAAAEHDCDIEEFTAQLIDATSALVSRPVTQGVGTSDA